MRREELEKSSFLIPLHLLISFTKLVKSIKLNGSKNGIYKNSISCDICLYHGYNFIKEVIMEFKSKLYIAKIVYSVVLMSGIIACIVDICNNL